MADIIDLRDDGTVRLAWDEHDVTLRRPKLREYRDLVEAQSAAAAELNQLVTADGMIRDLDLVGGHTDPDSEGGAETAPGPYLLLYAKALHLLGAADVDPWDLPPWMLGGAVFSDLVEHWRTNP